MLLRVRVRLAEAARARLPKLRLDGEARRCDCAQTPVSETARGKVEMELDTLRVPPRVPGWVGVKVA